MREIERYDILDAPCRTETDLDSFLHSSILGENPADLPQEPAMMMRRCAAAVSGL